MHIMNVCLQSFGAYESPETSGEVILAETVCAFKYEREREKDR
jgi:hypothetical protein